MYGRAPAEAMAQAPVAMAIEEQRRLEEILESKRKQSAGGVYRR